MKKEFALLLCVLVVLAFLSACGMARAKQDQLEVQGGEPISYQCEGGERIVARYYSLSDKSLHFVKVTMPDGQEYTLPNVLSASGARYTNDHLWVWWTKGESAFAETRDQSGEWYVEYESCQQIQ
jgi:membrane-bound inhibitor of C-type lysozyme